MIKDRLDAFPTPDRNALQPLLQAAFGSAPVGTIVPVKGGASSASVYSVEAGGRRYLLRVEGAASPLRNPHQYVSMRIAAEAGIAPRIHYIDETARVAVIDYIAQRPLETYPGGPHMLVRALGDLLRRVQATPAFPRFVEYPDIVARLWAHVCRSGLFAPGALDRHTERLAHIRDIYAWNPEKSVSSHNDPVPNNILFDGERLWMIDWESAYRNDPLVDVAIVLDNLAPPPELESIFLLTWLGRPADGKFYGRLEMIRALTRLYYAGVLLSTSAAAAWRVMPDTDASAMAPADFQRAIRDGQLVPGAAETRHALGKMYLAAFFSGTTPPGLAAAV